MKLAIAKRWPQEEQLAVPSCEGCPKGSSSSSLGPLCTHTLAQSPLPQAGQSVKIDTVLLPALSCPCLATSGSVAVVIANMAM